MESHIQKALETDRTIDITTIGRKSGQPRRIEIWYHHIGGKFYITGIPGPRSWYANVLKNPEFTFHLKGSAQADLPARATPILDEAPRREILKGILANIADDLQQADAELEKWVAKSPLVEITFLD